VPKMLEDVGKKTHVPQRTRKARPGGPKKWSSVTAGLMWGLAEAGKIDPNKRKRACLKGRKRGGGSRHQSNVISPPRAESRLEMEGWSMTTAASIEVKKSDAILVPGTRKLDVSSMYRGFCCTTNPEKKKLRKSFGGRRRAKKLQKPIMIRNHSLKSRNAGERIQMPASGSCEKLERS